MTQGDSHQRRPAQERTCEVRWIRPGRYGSEIDRWFSRFSQVPETRDDDYLISPRMPGLSIKIRGGASFEVKQYRGVVGALDNAAAAAGNIDSWIKRSIPLPGGLDRSRPLEGSAWRRVSKRRRIARFPIERSGGGPASPGAPDCSVELTEVEVTGQSWWTLGFEAGGRGALGRIKHTAAVVFAEPFPTASAFRAEEACSYAEWIHGLGHPGGTR
ncbi:MAG TPA: hypothetical protein VN686_10540 [Gaiellales bacterium]|nr:hypothetical protein [Gaiellales bacterium]